jgi:hypothetical protein
LIELKNWRYTDEINDDVCILALEIK